MFKEQSSTSSQSINRVQTSTTPIKKPVQKKYRKTSLNSDDDILQLDPLDSIYTDQNETFTNFNYYHRKKYINDEMRRRNEEYETKLMEKDLQLRKAELLVLTREDDIETLKIKHKQELVEIQREIEIKFRQKILDIEQDHAEEVKNLRQKLSDYEKELIDVKKQLIEAKTEVDVTKAILKSTNDRNMTLVEKIKELIAEKMTRRSNTKHKAIQADENSNNENTISDLDQIMLNLVENTQKRWRKKTKESKEKSSSSSKTRQDSLNDSKSETSNHSQSDNFLYTFQSISSNDLITKSESSSDQQSDESEKVTKIIKFPDLSNSNESKIVKKIMPVRKESICVRPKWKKALKKKENELTLEFLNVLNDESLTKEQAENITEKFNQIDENATKIDSKIQNSENLNKIDKFTTELNNKTDNMIDTNETILKSDKMKKKWLKNFNNLPKELEKLLFEWMKSKNIENENLNDKTIELSEKDQILKNSDKNSTEMLHNDKVKIIEVQKDKTKINSNLSRDSEHSKETLKISEIETYNNSTQKLIENDINLLKTSENDKNSSVIDENLPAIKIFSISNETFTKSDKTEISNDSITIKYEETIKTEIDSENDTNVQQTVTKTTKNDSQNNSDKILSKSLENALNRRNCQQPQNDMIERELSGKIESTYDNHFIQNELKMEENFENESNDVEKNLITEIHLNLNRKSDEYEIDKSCENNDKLNDIGNKNNSKSSEIKNFSLFKEKYDELFPKLEKNNGNLFTGNEKRKIEFFKIDCIKTETQEQKSEENSFLSNNDKSSSFERNLPLNYKNLFNIQPNLTSNEESSKNHQRLENSQQNRQHSPNRFDRSLRYNRTSPYRQTSFDSSKEDQESDRSSRSNERSSRLMHKKSSFYHNNDYRDYRDYKSSQNRSRSPHHDDRRSNSPFYDQTTSRRPYENRKYFNNDQKYSKFYKTPAYDRNRSSSPILNERYRKRSPQNDYKPNWRQNEYFTRKTFNRNNREFSPTRKQQHFYRENSQRFDFRRNNLQDERQFREKSTHYERNISYDDQNKTFYQKNQNFKFEENLQKKFYEESCIDMEKQIENVDEIATNIITNNNKPEGEKRAIFKRRHSVYVDRHFEDSDKISNYRENFMKNNQKLSLSNENLDKIETRKKVINPFSTQEKSTNSTIEDLSKINSINLSENQQKNDDNQSKKSEKTLKIDSVETFDEIQNKISKLNEKDPRLRKNERQNDVKLELDDQQQKAKRSRLDSIGSNSDKSSLSISVPPCYKNDKKLERQSSISSQISNSSSTTSNVTKQNSSLISTNYEAKILKFTSEIEILKIDQEILKFCRENSEKEENLATVCDQQIESMTQVETKCIETNNQDTELTLEFEAENEIVSDGQSEYSYSIDTPIASDYSQNDEKLSKNCEEKEISNEKKGIKIISVVSFSAENNLNNEITLNEDSQKVEENSTKIEHHSEINEINSKEIKENLSKNEEISKEVNKNLSIDEILTHLHEESKQDNKNSSSVQDNDENLKNNDKTSHDDREILSESSSAIKNQEEEIKNVKINSKIFVSTSRSEHADINKADESETICDIEREIRSIICSDSNELVTFKVKEQEKDPLAIDNDDETQNLMEEIEIKTKKERKKRNSSKTKKLKKAQRAKEPKRKKLIIPAVYNLRNKQQNESRLIYSDISSDESSQSSETINRLIEAFDNEDIKESKIETKNSNKNRQIDKQQNLTNIYCMKDDVTSNDKEKKFEKAKRRVSIAKRKNNEEFCGNRLIDSIRSTCNQLISESSSESETNKSKPQIQAQKSEIQNEKIETCSNETPKITNLPQSTLRQSVITTVTQAEITTAHSLLQLASSPSILKFDSNPKAVSDVSVNSIKKRRQSMYDPLMCKKTNTLFEKEPSLLKYLSIDSSLQSTSKSIVDEKQKNYTVANEIPLKRLMEHVDHIQTSSVQQQLCAYRPSIVMQDQPLPMVTEKSDKKNYEQLTPTIRPLNINHLVPALKVDYQQLSATSPIQTEVTNNFNSFVPIKRTNSKSNDSVIEAAAVNSPPRTYGGSLITSDQLTSCQSSPTKETEKINEEVTAISLSASNNSEETEQQMTPLFSPSPQPFIVEDVARYEARRTIRKEISKIVISELNVFYEMKKFESEKPKELFKAMVRELTKHFSEMNPDKMPNKNEIKNYIFEIFYNKDVIKSSEDFLLNE